MNINNIIGAIVFTLLLAIGGVAHAFVGSIAVGLGEMDENIGRIQTSFSADATLETEEMNATARVYYQPGRVRDEINMGAEPMVMINRFDLDKVWIIMGQGMYMEVDPDEGSDQAPEFKLISREIIGRETVNGMDTTKYKSVYETKDGKFGGFTWYTDDNIAVKAFMISETKGEKQRMKFEFSNLERGPQADSLFEIPAGYKKFEMGNFANMAGMGGQMPQQGVPGGVMPAAGTPPAAPPPAGSPNAANEDGNFVEELAEDASQEAKDSVSDEITKGIGNSVRKGIGKLFGGG